MKRGNDNSQLRADEVEALNEADEETAGTFRRASAEEMARRKIVRTKRPSTNSTIDAEEEPKSSLTNPFGKVDQLATKNPFSSFGGLVAPTPVVVAEKPVIQNPFSGFSGLTSSSLNTINTSVKFPTTTISSETNTSDDSEFKKKLKKLNNSFFSWVSRQVVENPVCIWKDGLKDYIKYYDELTEKYGNESSEKPFNNSVSFKLDEKKLDTITTAAIATKPVSNQLSFNNSAAVNPPATNLFSFGNNNQNPISVPANSNNTNATTSSSNNNTNASSGFSFDFSKQPTTTTSFTDSFKFAPLPQPTNSLTMAPVPSVNFNFGGNNSFASSFTSTSTFQLPPVATSKGDDNNDDNNNDDDEGEPILEPEKVLRNEADTDDILHDVVCKLFRYDKESNEWKDIGKGSFRITYNSETKKQRMLVRNLIGKITFNASFFKGMKITADKKSIRFSAFIANEEIVLENGKNITKTTTELKTFMLKVKDSDLSVTVNKIEEGIASVV